MDQQKTNKKDQFLEKPSFEINSLEELDKILNQSILQVSDNKKSKSQPFSACKICLL